jgi:hypothetical protein
MKSGTHLLGLINLLEVVSLRTFENRVLRSIFGPVRNEVTGGWRKLHNEELHNLYSSLNIIQIIKSRSMRAAGHVARMRRREISLSLSLPPFLLLPLWSIGHP